MDRARDAGSFVAMPDGTATQTLRWPWWQVPACTTVAERPYTTGTAQRPRVRTLSALTL
jgi:hypothetical protein